MSAAEQPPLASRRVRCPGCGGDSAYGAANPHRPFCSARCQGLDFSAWASEDYRVQARPDPADIDEGSPMPPRGADPMTGSGGACH